MKIRRFFILTLLAAAAACTEEETGEELRVKLTAETVEGAAGPSWSEDSSAGAWSENGRNHRLSYLSEAGLFHSFSLKNEGRTLVYTPFDAGTAPHEGALAIAIPSHYTLSDNGAIPQNVPMAGYMNGLIAQVEMHHLLGYLDLPLIGGCALKSLQFTTLDKGRSVTGTVRLDLSANQPWLEARLEGRDKSISISIPEDIPYTDTLHILIPLPEASYNSFELAFEGSSGEVDIRSFSDKAFSITRGAVTPLEAIKASNIDLLRSFKFAAGATRFVTRDIPLYIDHKAGTISANLRNYVGLKSIAPTFELAEGAVAYVDGEIQQSGVTPQNFYQPVTYVVTDGKGLTEHYTVSIDHFTGLPVMIIDTPNAQTIDSKEIWIEGTSIHIDGVGIYEDYDTVTDDPDFIRGRGNATWQRFEKKSYNIKLGKRASLLGMPAHKRWCLMANYRDRIKIRNDIAFYIANGMRSMGWNCHGEFVEIILNGRHIGMYEVVEQIKIDPNRVDITEFETDEDDNFINLDESNITGGYIFMIDAYYDEAYKFRSSRLNLPVEFKDPNDKITPEMMSYAQSLFNTLEDKLYAYDFKAVYEIIDMDSFIDFWLLNDLVENDDAANRHSDFLHKDRGGKLIAGPVWDFDSFTWRSTDQHFNMRKSMWYPYLLKDKAFCRRAVQRWNSYRDFLLTVPDYAARRCASIEKSEAYDAALWWPIVGNANNFGDEHLSFREALTRMQTNFAGRFANMETYLKTIEDTATYDSEK